MSAANPGFGEFPTQKGPRRFLAEVYQMDLLWGVPNDPCFPFSTSEGAKVPGISGLQLGETC